MGKEAQRPAATRSEVPKATKIEFTPGVPTERVFPNGTTILVVTRAFDRSGVGPTERHEAAHVVVANGEIYSATIIPSGDSLGSTVPKEMTRAAAAAGAAIGDYRGASWDLFLVEYFLGGNKQSAIAEASAALSGMEEELYQVALMLKKHLTIGPEEVKKAYQIADDIKNGVYSAEVQVHLPTGETKSVQIKSDNHLVEVHKNLFESTQEQVSNRRGHEGTHTHAQKQKNVQEKNETKPSQETAPIGQEAVSIEKTQMSSRRGLHLVKSELQQEQETPIDEQQFENERIIYIEAARKKLADITAQEQVIDLPIAS